MARATAIHVGVALSKFVLTAIVLVAALPSASNVAMLAERYQADDGRTIRFFRIILVTTVAAIVTFSMAVVLLA